MMKDGNLISYDTWTRIEEELHESRCFQCGKCCGSDDGDPCTKLRENPDGTYYCVDYDNRLGPQKTVSGADFTCVTIREVIRKGHLRPGCGYHVRF